MKDRTHPVLTFTTVRELEAYLSGELADSSGFWLKLSKIGAPEPTLSKAEAIEAALCCGWIDGQLGGLDDHYFLVRMPPRPGGQSMVGEQPRDRGAACTAWPAQACRPCAGRRGEN